MPQIWPMNWIILFILFTCVLILMIASIYFNFLYNNNENAESSVNPTKILNWKW